MSLIKEHNLQPRYLTIGELKEKIKNMDDNSHVFYQRIEDIYFEPNKGWEENSVYKRDLLIGDEEYDSSDKSHHDQFVEAFSAYSYEDDPNLYLTAHY